MRKHGNLNRSRGYDIFYGINLIFLTLLALLCVAPLLNLLSLSLSAGHYAAAGKVTFWPIEPTTASYEIVFANKVFWNSLGVSVERVILGTSLTLVVNILTSYPLSMDSSYFHARRYYLWYFFFTTLFSGGLIPTFLVVKFTGLYDTIWALVLPGCANVWNCILMLNFFRQLPKELSETAVIDGAGHFSILFRIIVPISKPVLATVTLFTMVGHWNDWFGGMVYMSTLPHYPLQTYLQSILHIDLTQIALSSVDFRIQEKIQLASSTTIRSAMVFVTALPIMMVYPFLQKYFTKGIVLGSVKG